MSFKIKCLVPKEQVLWVTSAILHICSGLKLSPPVRFHDAITH